MNTAMTAAAADDDPKLPAGEGRPPAPPPAPVPAAQEDDWWEGFRKAVEDPATSTYGYLRDRLVRSLELGGAHGLAETVVAARRKAVKELAGLTDPHELSEKLKGLEGNQLVFSYETRSIMKVSRVLIDTYIGAHEECEHEARHAHEGGCAADAHRRAAEKIVARELAADVQAQSAFDSIAAALRHKDPAEIQATLREAARQMAGESARITQDVLHLGRAYLKPDNIANILIHTLPLISWEYRWAMALALGTWSARKAGAHAWRGARHLARGRVGEARKAGAESMRALRRAGADMLLAGLSPALGHLPALIVPAATFVLNKTYGAVTQTLGDMLAQEEEKPGTTPLSRGLRQRIGGFLHENQDSLASMGVKVLTSLVPSTVTAVLAETTARLPLTRIRILGGRLRGLGGSLARRFNLHAADARPPAFDHADTRAILGARRDAAGAGQALRETYRHAAAAGRQAQAGRAQANEELANEELANEALANEAQARGAAAGKAPPAP
jgi:hypothetical protein